MSFRRYVLAFFSLMGVVLIFWISSAPQEEQEFNIARERGHFRKQIETLGGERAYTLFVERYEEDKYTSVQHGAAHLFGEILFKVQNISGVAVCDSSLAYGCYHGFFTQAVLESGLSILPLLDEACGNQKTGSPCRHGIGHGLMEYFGTDHLDDALRSCPKAKREQFMGGCSSGVFMEYNVPLVEDNGEFVTTVRTLDTGSEYGPCTSVDDQFKESCYHELPQWWKQVYKNDYALMGELCNKVESHNERRACFLGIGNNIAPSSYFDEKIAIEYCSLMPDTYGNTMCRLAAAQGFSWDIKNRFGVIVLCDGIEEFDGYACPDISTI